MGIAINSVTRPKVIIFFVIIFSIFLENQRSEKMNQNTELVFPPLRSMDDFILAKSRFQVPEYQNMQKFQNRIVSNLIYYQTNYAISALGIFGLITFMNPFKMSIGILTMALIFGHLYYLDASQIQVKKVKNEHPTLVMLGTFLAAYFFIHLSGCVMVFICGVLLPIKFTILHAALRLRNMKNKMASMAEIAGVGKKTPMAVILAEWGIEPDLKYLS